MPELNELTAKAKGTKQNSEPKEGSASKYSTTNLSEFKPEDISGLKVSVRSARYIHIVDSVCALWKELTDALEEDYGPKSGEEAFKKDFEEALIKIQDETFDYLRSSIFENMSNAKRTEVI